MTLAAATPAGSIATLQVVPADLAAGGTRLQAQAQTLAVAVARFQAVAARWVPELGPSVADAVADGLRRGAAAATVVEHDIVTVAHALRQLATSYDQLDQTAVPSGAHRVPTSAGP